MNRTETALLLAAIAGRDQRTVGETDVLAWHEDLEDLDLEDARDAVRRHFRESTDRIMPAHVRRLVKQIRAERAKGASAPLALPSRYELDAARDARTGPGAEQCRRVLAEIARRAAELKVEEEQAPLSPSDEIRQRALARATAERRQRRIDGPEPIATVAARVRGAA